MIAIDYVVIETSDDCNNVGPCCYGCPAFDGCDHHFED